MTQAEFDKIKEDFDRETARFEALRPGQRIYVTTGWDNFEHEVISVDVPNRTIRCYDHSLKGIETTIRGGAWHEKPPPCM